MNRKKLKAIPHRLAGAGRYRQGGVVLWITLVVLVVLLAASVLIARNTTLGQGIAGNLGFKRNATMAGDLGTEVARTWIGGRTKIALHDDDLDQGYVANWGALSDDPNDSNAFDWSKAVNAGGSAGNSVSYLIHRMCRFSGPTEGAIVDASGAALGVQECIYVSNPDGDRTVGSQASNFPPAVRNPFYRVTSRIVGPRNTVSYVQSMLY